ncbi:MAG: hypothetical protein AUG49_15295 [Catenulispora sp. 13_1_20CM_3_70_7]|nr:MAG: hypothetical protein AUG49_15295 [Catenulispora sp. 13_1_20CM_3_70_7]
MTTSSTLTDFITEAEQTFASQNPVGFITCDPCQDFRTDVSFGVEHPCRHCQPMRFLAWRLCHEGTGLQVLVDGVQCVVLLPPAGGPIVQPCEFPHCDNGCVLVRPILRGNARWVELNHVKILTPWEGA